MVANTDGGASNPDLSFSYPTEFLPAATATSKHWGSDPIGLSGLTTITGWAALPDRRQPPDRPGSGHRRECGASTPFSPSSATSTSLVITPLLKALGTDIGSADVTATALQCNTPTLSG